MKHALLSSLLLELSCWELAGTAQEEFCGSSSPQQGNLSVGYLFPHWVLTMLLTSAGILPSYRCEARTGRKKLVGMQPGGNSRLLSLLKYVCPAEYLFLVRAEEEPPVQPRSVPGARI